MHKWAVILFLSIMLSFTIAIEQYYKLHASDPIVTHYNICVSDLYNNNNIIIITNSNNSNNINYYYVNNNYYNNYVSYNKYQTDEFVIEKCHPALIVGDIIQLNHSMSAGKLQTSTPSKA